MLPVAPQWQIKQVNTIDGVRHVDRCVAFGGRRSGDLFIAFMSLVLWIAEHCRCISHPNGFVDDCFAIQVGHTTTFYPPLNRHIPVEQAQMLSLWDELGIPYKPHKQQHGTKLIILGIEVDVDNLTLTLPEAKRRELVEELDRFIFARGKKPNRFIIREFQVLAGWMNWALNVFPLLRPALCNVYARMRSRAEAKTRVKVTREVSDDLAWARQHILQSSGVLLLQARDWEIDKADVTMYTDACLSGMGVFCPGSNLGLWGVFDGPLPSEWIYYRELWATVTALQFATTSMELRGKRVVIFTDNSNTVDAFNTLAVEPTYNGMLKFAVDLLIKHDCHLRVLHIPGTQNAIADALSRRQLERVKGLRPDVQIDQITPPRDALGVALQ